MKLLLALLFTLPLPLLTHAGSRTCLVVKIADGDTLTARCGTPGAFEEVKIRLAEIDAPEKNQPFGTRSRQALADLCFHRLASIQTLSQDRYGRTVARVSCDGQDANAAQVRSGMAWAYTRYVTDAAIPRLEATARAERRGLWIDPDPTQPWEWRRQSRH